MYLGYASKFSNAFLLAMQIHLPFGVFKLGIRANGFPVGLYRLFSSRPKKRKKRKKGVMRDWNNKLKENKNSHIKEIEARGVQLDLWLDPPTQLVWADSTLVTIGNGSPSPKTKTDESVGRTAHGNLIFNRPIHQNVVVLR